ncbi:hypothetical protein B0A48_17588 [Cryoendolithus antarcticus]|uniref:F-box domain-containing protein n=1 Tax=Cryoendolithus antarcticus TaxID=1507870 RepID=A0A1V8SB31_9PEZI|nr:hypothetical protein B0A48_17588 [Cryoendolithus antarcticus]
MALPKIFAKRRGRSIRVKRSQPPSAEPLPKRRSLVRMASVFGSSAKVAPASTPTMIEASASQAPTTAPLTVSVIPKPALPNTTHTDAAPPQTAPTSPQPVVGSATGTTSDRIARANSAWARNARVNGPPARTPVARLDPATLSAVRETLDGNYRLASAVSLAPALSNVSDLTVATRRPAPQDLSTPALHQAQSLFCTHLPAELRLLIFTSLLDVKLDCWGALSIPLSSARVAPEPYILSCRQIYYETMDLYRKAYWARNTFILDKTYFAPWAVSVRPADLGKIQRFSVQVPGRRILIEIEEGEWVARETDASLGNIGQMYLASVRSALRVVNERRERVIERGARIGGMTLEDLTTIMGIAWLR